jgi:two-component system sensor histidine kinase/response regulator
MKLTAIVVDDMEIDVTLVSHLLKKMGVVALGFVEPLAALSWCESNTPDLVLVDYMMPQLNGIEFIKRFRALPHKKQIPIIMLTAKIDREVKLKAYESSVNDFLLKPVDGIEFSIRVQNILELRKIQLDLIKANDDKLSIKARRHQAVIEASTDGYLVVDMQGGLLEANEAYSHLSGYSNDDLLAMNICDLEAKMDRADVAEQLKLIAQKKHVRFETVHRARSGNCWPVEVSVSYIQDEDGGRCYSFLHDISRRKENEELLLKLSLAVEQSPNAILISNTQGRIEYVNAAFSEISGYSAEEAIGQITGFLKSKHTPASTYEDLWSTLRQGNQWQGEFINQRKNGEFYNDFAIVSPMRQADGKITHYVSIQKDITEKKMIEQEVELYRLDLENLVITRTQEYLDAKKQAEEANRAKSDFLANMSHEIRTPINAIIGFNELCLRTNLNDQQRDYLTKSGSASNTLLKLINEILDISKIEAGQMEIETIPIDIEQLFKNVCHVLTPQLAKKSLKLRINLEPDIQLTHLKGDPLRLQQILLNLCGNAIKFSDTGILRLSCQQVSRAEDNLTLRFSVQDSGIGMSSEQISSLFQPFKQADSSMTRRFGGTGLGLSICKGLIEKMGGEIWVESELGQGSTFSFTVNFAIGDGSEQISKDHDYSRATLEQEMSRLRGINLLLVEDNDFNQQVASDLLSQFGLNVDVANNGSEAIKRVESKNYAVVLMDLQMPVMDGYEATTKIRSNSRFKDLPIIALTANVLSFEKERSLKAGMNDLLAKPIVPEHLFEALLNWVATTTVSPSESSMSVQLDKVASQPLSIPDCADSVEYPGINSSAPLKRMRGDVAAFERMVAIFCEKFHGIAESMQAALDKKDYETLELHAHTVKGAAATIGADELSRISAQIEALCKTQSPACAELLNELKSALDIVMSGQSK